MALMSGATHVIQWMVQKAKPRGGGNPKSHSQFGLKSATRLHEGGFASIVDQHATVNTFPGLVHTARQAMEVGSAQSRILMRLRRVR